MRGIKFYGFLSEDAGKFDAEFPSRNKFIYVLPTQYRDGYFINAEESADFICISTFKHGYFQEDGWRRSGRRRENIYSIMGSFLDIDSEFPLSHEIILQRIESFNLPLPTYIIETSPNHYQIIWLYEKELILKKEGLLEWWEWVQRLLYEVFEDLGADPNALDACRFIRNFLGLPHPNRKYPEKPTVQIVYKGEKTTLKEIYKALKDAKMERINEKRTRRRKDSRSFRESMKNLVGFFREHCTYIGTYRELSQKLGIPERTLYLLIGWLRLRGKLRVNKIREGRTWKSKFLWTQENDTARNSTNNFSGLLEDDVDRDEYEKIGYIRWLRMVISDLVSRFENQGISEGYRNSCVFLLSLGLKRLGYAKERVVELLWKGFELSRKRGLHEFGLREFLRTVESAFSPRYKLFYDFSHPEVLQISSALSVIEC